MSRIQTSLLLSMVVHLGCFALAGSVAMPTFSAAMQTTGGVVMTELVAPPEPATAPPGREPPLESSPTDREEPAVPPEAEIAPASKSASATEGAASRNGVPGTRLTMDLARMAWVQQVVVKTLKYQRNAPKGFEEMVRAALAAHPVVDGGTAKISFRFDPSGTVRGVEIRSDSPELKSALDRVGWDTAPLPSRDQIPCSGVDVTVSVAGERLSVGVEIL